MVTILVCVGLYSLYRVTKRTVGLVKSNPGEALRWAGMFKKLFK